MTNAIAPFWDGNETWLVLVGATQFGAFPMVWGAGVVVFPVVLFYTIWVYWIFRGKLHKGYH